jgi:acylphosphatase
MNMNKTRKKVNINIKGSLQDLFYHVLAKYKAKKLGLKTNSIIHIMEGHMEIELTGERERLWEMIHWAKKGPFFAYVNEVTFQFSEED